MLRRVVAGAALALIVLSVVGPGIGGAGPAGTDGPLAQAAPGEFTDTTFEITVFVEGDGRWTVRHSRPLETDDERAQFEAVAEEFRTTETETFLNFRERASRLTASGAESTGRNMTASDFRRDAFIDERGQTTGVIEMSFRWSDVATVEDDRIILADIFAGGWAITDGQWLVVRPGDGAVFAEAPVPTPDRGLESVELAEAPSVTWFGERQFADRRPRVVLRPASNADGNETTTDGTATDGTTTDDATTDGTTTDDATTDGTATDDTETPPGNDGGNGWVAMVSLALGFVLLVGIGGGVAYYRRTVRRDGETAATDSASTAAESDLDTGEGAVVTDAELLSDEDRVLQLLEQNGGRMKQVAIVEETEWSKSKVSMLLSDMEADDTISKLRVGRENIISLAGEEPEAAGSPFDDEE